MAMVLLMSLKPLNLTKYLSSREVFAYFRLDLALRNAILRTDYGF